MNRIRQYENKFQVLITPHHIFDKAYQMPDINWDQMVLWHKDIFSKIHNIVKYELSVNKFNVELEPKLLNPMQVKNIMFNRVMIFGERFRLGYHMNDIISFHIINPYTAILNEIEEILSINNALRIIYKTKEKGTTRLVGKTDIGTLYEIILWPTLISQWAKWSHNNKNIPENIKLNNLEKTMKQQQIIDKSDMQYK
jgi:hypothetical protein